MKKTAIAILTLAVGIMAASCHKEAEQETKSFKPMTINAVSEGIGTETRTEMAYKYDILWSDNDQIYVTDGTHNDTFKLTGGAGTTAGTFTQNGTATFTSEVKAYYPATIVDGGGNSGGRQTRPTTRPFRCTAARPSQAMLRTSPSQASDPFYRLYSPPRRMTSR